MAGVLKNYAQVLIRIACCCLVLYTVLTYNAWAQQKAEEEAAAAAEAARGSYPVDGTFEGTAEGYGGPVVVEITIEGGSIANAQIISAKKEDKQYLDAASVITDRIVERQTADVDTVSGATLSSNGIIRAANNALINASESAGS